MKFTRFKSIFIIPKKNVFECILPLVYLSRFLDYLNFTIDGNLTNSVIKIKAINIIAFIGYRLFYTTVLVVSIMKGPETYNSYLMDTGNYVFLVICCVSTVLSVTIVFISR